MMPIVTDLQVKGGKSERVRLHLDDGCELELPAVQAARLRRGQDISAAEVQRLIDESAIASAMDLALRYLSSRPRSAEEVRRRLAKAGRDRVVIAAAMERLREQQYVDDAAFARFWIENRLAFNPMSARAITYELIQKGVDREAFEGLLEATDEDAAAIEAAKKQLWRYRSKTRAEFRARLGAMLQRRGFDYETIARAVEGLEMEVDQSQADFFACEKAE